MIGLAATAVKANAGEYWVGWYGINRSDELLPPSRALASASQMAEVTVPRELFAAILDRIQRFGVPPPLLRRE